MGVITKAWRGGPAGGAPRPVDVLQPLPSASAPAAEEQPRVKLPRSGPGLPLRAVREDAVESHQLGADQLVLSRFWSLMVASTSCFSRSIRKLPMDNYKKFSQRGGYFLN